MVNFAQNSSKNRIFPKILGFWPQKSQKMAKNWKKLNFSQKIVNFDPKNGKKSLFWPQNLKIWVFFYLKTVSKSKKFKKLIPKNSLEKVNFGQKSENFRKNLKIFKFFQFFLNFFQFLAKNQQKTEKNSYLSWFWTKKIEKKPKFDISKSILSKKFKIFKKIEKNSNFDKKSQFLAWF